MFFIFSSPEYDLILIGYHENVGICISFLVFCNVNRNSALELHICLHWKGILHSYFISEHTLFPSKSVPNV